MKSKVNIADIQLNQLDSMSLIQITKFAHMLERRTGKILAVRDENILTQIVTEAKHTKCPELQEVYQRLKLAIKAQISKGELDIDDLTVVANQASATVSFNSFP